MPIVINGQSKTVNVHVFFTQLDNVHYIVGHCHVNRRECFAELQSLIRLGVCHGCVIDVPWMCHGLVTGVSLVYDGCVIDVPRVCDGCVIDVPRVCDGCVIDVPLVCLGLVTGVSLVCDGCVIDVSRLCLAAGSRDRGRRSSIQDRPSQLRRVHTRPQVTQGQHQSNVSETRTGGHCEFEYLCLSRTIICDQSKRIERMAEKFKRHNVMLNIIKS